VRPLQELEIGFQILSWRKSASRTHARQASGKARKFRKEIMAVPQSVTPQEPLMTRITKWPQEIKDYFDDLKKEMRLVTWPSWKQVRATTTVVIVAVFMFAAYFWAVDMFFSFVLGRLLTAGGK